jgi:molybdopterin-containing oxidoreductase family iron-sulfur binding subunit
VRETWRNVDWDAALRLGVISGSARPAVRVAPRPIAVAGPQEDTRGWQVRFVADEAVLDGQLANSAWLQELPRADSKLTWDNAALLSPNSAKALGVATATWWISRSVIASCAPPRG